MKYVIKVDVDVIKTGFAVLPERERKILDVDITHESSQELSDADLKEIVINVIKSFKALDELEKLATNLKKDRP